MIRFSKRLGADSLSNNVHVLSLSPHRYLGDNDSHPVHLVGTLQHQAKHGKETLFCSLALNYTRERRRRSVDPKKWCAQTLQWHFVRVSREPVLLSLLVSASRHRFGPSPPALSEKQRFLIEYLRKTQGEGDGGVS